MTLRRSVVILGLMATTFASAQTFPPVPRETAIYDGANLVSPSDRQAITELSHAFLRDTGAPIAVATFPSLASVGASSIENYGTALFNRWRIGRNDANGGILLLVAKADRKTRIVLGKDWARDYDEGARQINQQTILPAFKQGDFSGGIRRGCEALARLASSNNQAPNAAYSDPDDGSSLPTGLGAMFAGLGLLGCLCPVAALFGLIFLFRSIRRGATQQTYSNPYQRSAYYDPNAGDDDDPFVAGMIAGEMLNQPPPYDPGPTYDPGPSYDSGGFDSGSSDSGGFDSGSSDGGGDTGSW